MSSGRYSRVSTNDDFVGMQMQEQKRAMADQDDALDRLSKSVTRIGDASLAISHELDSQNKMIDELDDELEHASEGVDMVTRRTKELLRKSGGPKWFSLIIGLILVLALLIFLIIYLP